MESHIRYLKEVRAPALMEVGSMVVGSDAKRLHVAHVMSVEGIERATFECLLLHFDTRAGKTAPLPEAAQDALKREAMVPAPDWSGRRVSLQRQ